MVIPKVHHTTTAQSAGYEGLEGGALNKLFAKCINFALLATMLIPVTVMIRTVIVTAVTVVMMLMMVTAGVRIIL